MISLNCVHLWLRAKRASVRQMIGSGDGGSRIVTMWQSSCHRFLRGVAQIGVDESPKWRFAVAKLVYCFSVKELLRPNNSEVPNNNYVK